MTIPLSNKQIENPDLYRWLLEQKQEFKEEMIFFLTGHEKQKTRSIYKEKSQLTESGFIKRTGGEIEKYVPLNKNTKQLMSLDNGMQLATFISNMIDPLASTTYYDPAIRINRLASLFGLMAGQMLDNPRYKFEGNETDAASFTLMVCKKMGEVMGRSRGGFLLREVAESTTNIQSNNINPNQQPNSLLSMQKKPGFIERTFAGQNQRR